MHRISILIVLASLGVGCAADSGDESFIIRSNMAVPDTGCVLTPDLNGLSLSRGELFLGSPRPYVLHPLFESRIVAAEGTESKRTIFLKGADIDLVIGPIETVDSAGNVTVDATEETLKFGTLFSTALAPNGGLSAGEFDVVPLEALSRIRARAGDSPHIHAQVRATATAYGDYYGDEIRSAPFQFPVTVCNDCVVGIIAPMCPMDMGSLPRLGNACNPYQDGVVDCCQLPDALQCPATVSTTPPLPPPP